VGAAALKDVTANSTQLREGKMKNNDELDEAFEKRALAGDGTFAIALAILRLVYTQHSHARAIQRLGNGDASTGVGAIEGLGMQIGKVAQAIADRA
jgi:hypothetical protein